MNYKKIYDMLIERAKDRHLTGYYEVHHIIPRCLGGSDSKDNLISLTPEEHYVAHQLLSKINPHHNGLLYAAVMMCSNRPSNKLYGWLRRRLSVIQSEKMLSGGSPTQDKRWISNEHETILVNKDIANISLLNGTYISGKSAIRPSCGHLVKRRCVSCDNLKRKSYDKKIEDAKIIANSLFEEFKNSTTTSVCEFAKLKNTSQPRLSALWKKYVDQYSSNRKQGKSFK